MGGMGVLFQMLDCAMGWSNTAIYSGRLRVGGKNFRIGKLSMWGGGVGGGGGSKNGPGLNIE